MSTAESDNSFFFLFYSFYYCVVYNNVLVSIFIYISLFRVCSTLAPCSALRHKKSTR